MKFMTNIARGMFVVGCCLFISGTSLNAAKPERELEPYKTIDITEASSVMAVDKAAAPEKAAAPVAIDSAAAVTTVKKKVTQTPKGVVYLPIVSLGSYIPIGAQILMMLLMIAVSGLFGAWLMFREIAKRVQVLQENAPIAVPAPQHSESALMQAVLAIEEETAPTQIIRAPVKKRTLFVGQKTQAYSNPQTAKLDSLVQGVHKSVQQQSVEPNGLEYAPPSSKKRIKAVKQSEDSKSNRMPKKFLINEWFPVER